MVVHEVTHFISIFLHRNSYILFPEVTLLTNDSTNVDVDNMTVVINKIFSLEMTLL